MNLKEQIGGNIDHDIKNLINFTGSSTNNLQDYLSIVNYHQQTKHPITRKKVLITLLSTLPIFILATVANISFIEPAQAAAENDFERYMNPASAVFFNALIGGYFFDLMVAPMLNELFESAPEIQPALYRLEDLDPSNGAKALRVLKGSSLFLLKMGVSILPAYVNYALDRAGSSDHPIALSVIVLAVNAALNYNVVCNALDHGIPRLLSPAKTLYRRYNPVAQKNHEEAHALSLLKKAHMEHLNEIARAFLTITQTDDKIKLKEIYQLLEKKNSSKEDTLKLVLALCRLNPKKQFQHSPYWRYFAIGLGEIITVLSLPGYYLLTQKEAAKFTQLQDTPWEVVLGITIFSVSLALSAMIAWEVSDNLYELTASAIRGIKESWYSSNSFTHFCKRAWDNKFNLAGWHQITQLPLAIQQNPRISTLIFGSLGFACAYSVATSNQLNKEYLGELVANILKIPTTLGTMMFNFYPTPIIWSSIQRFYTQLWGGEQSKQQIQLQYFIQDLQSLGSKITDKQFTLLIREFFSFAPEELFKENMEEFAKLFLGIDNWEEIYGENRQFASEETTVTEILTASKTLTQVGMFKKPSKEYVPLLSFANSNYQTLTV